MCTLIVRDRVVPGLPVVAASSRNEFYSRPAAAPARVEPQEEQDPSFLAPQDLGAGGTWMGLNAKGLFVGLTNRRTAATRIERRSRSVLLEKKGHPTVKRIGSNLRPPEQKPHRNLRNIIRYTDAEPPQNNYPKSIISTPRQQDCCTEENREVVGTIREVDGFKFCYKICQKCGHAVRYFYPAVKTNDQAVREYRAWKRYMTQ